MGRVGTYCVCVCLGLFACVCALSARQDASDATPFSCSKIAADLMTPL